MVTNATKPPVAKSEKPVEKPTVAEKPAVVEKPKAVEKPAAQAETPQKPARKPRARKTKQRQEGE